MMKEADWLSSMDPDQLLDFLHGKVSDRKLRLFACAATRRFLHWLDTEHDRRAIDIAEQMADGTVPQQEYGDAHIRGFDHDLGSDDAYYSAIGAVCIAEVRAAEDLGDGLPSEVYRESEAREREVLCALLRDIVGNPFRPNRVDHRWLTWNGGAVVKLAATIYDERIFNRLPVLADALEAAGCTDERLLPHCRLPGEHVRGCWAIDLLLGKV